MKNKLELSITIAIKRNIIENFFIFQLLKCWSRLVFLAEPLER